MIPADSDAPPVPCAIHVASRVRPGARLVDYMKDRLALVPVTEVGDLITGNFTWIRTGTNWALGRTVDLLADGDSIAISTAALAGLEKRARWTPPWDGPLTIVYEDGDLLIADKPACQHVHPLGDRREGTLVNALVHHAGGGSDGAWASWRPHPVQRLDFVVSGLLAVAKHPKAKDALVRAQKKHGIERTYVALVQGVVGGESGVVDAPVGRERGRGYRRAVVAIEDGGLRAVTRWKVLERFADRTLLEVAPQTGRTHQIRVHLAHLGHPILGDSLYADDDALVPSRIGSTTGRTPSAAIALHAIRLRLPHPGSGEVVVADSALPQRFRDR